MFTSDSDIENARRLEQERLNGARNAAQIRAENALMSQHGVSRSGAKTMIEQQKEEAREQAKALREAVRREMKNFSITGPGVEGDFERGFVINAPDQEGGGGGGGGEEQEGEWEEKNICHLGAPATQEFKVKGPPVAAP